MNNFSNRFSNTMLGVRRAAQAAGLLAVTAGIGTAVAEQAIMFYEEHEETFDKIRQKKEDRREKRRLEKERIREQKRLDKKR